MISKVIFQGFVLLYELLNLIVAELFGIFYVMGICSAIVAVFTIELLVNNGRNSLSCIGTHAYGFCVNETLECDQLLGYVILGLIAILMAPFVIPIFTFWHTMVRMIRRRNNTIEYPFVIRQNKNPRTIFICRGVTCHQYRECSQSKQE